MIFLFILKFLIILNLIQKSFYIFYFYVFIIQFTSKCFQISSEEYVRIKQIGSGSYGTACIVKEKSTGLFYIRKVLQKKNKQQENKAIKEALVLQHLNLRVHHYGLPVFKTYIVKDQSVDIIYEYLLGTKMSQYITNLREKPINNNIIFKFSHLQNLLKQLIYITRFAHQQGICHCDIKPDQILVNTKSNNINLIDWGEAYDIKYELDDNYEESEIQIGNILFVPPELILEDKYTERQSYKELCKLKKYSLDSYVHQQLKIIPQDLSKSNVSYSETQSFVLSTASTPKAQISADFQDYNIQNKYNKQISFIGTYTFPRHHHISILFQQHTSEDKLEIWTQALSRFYHYSCLSTEGDTTLNLPLEAETISENLPFFATQFNVQKITPELLYKLNLAMAHDSYSIGMTLLYILFQIPNTTCSVIESLGQLKILRQKIINQCVDTMQQIINEHQEFKLFYQEVQRTQHLFQISSGVLPQKLGVDLLFLIAGLLHENNRVRLSVQEAACCPLFRQENFNGEWTVEDSIKVKIFCLISAKKQIIKMQQELLILNLKVIQVNSDNIL